MAIFEGTDGNDFFEATVFGHDIMRGYDGNDILYSGNGNDRLHGHKGDDTLNSGSGDDELWGGSGDDSFIFGLNGVHDGDRDIIHDYQPGMDAIYIAAKPANVDLTIRDDRIIAEGNGNKIVVMVDNADPGDIFII